MSLQSIFLSIEAFLEKVFGAIKKEWNNLEPLAKTYVQSAINFVNLLKAAALNPAQAGIIGIIISNAEALLGTAVTNAIISVLGEVLVDLGIVAEAITDPNAALQALLDHLASFKGNKLADELYNTTKYIAVKLVPALTRAKANILIQWVWDELFSGQPAITLNIPSEDVTDQANPVKVDAPDVNAQTQPGNENVSGVQNKGSN